MLESTTFRFRSSFLPIHARIGDAEAVRTPPVDTCGPEAWARRARVLGIEAPPDSDTYRVALILLASQELGQNIDRLARRTGASRQLVAKAARRLVDNGVWADGRTVALWTADPTAGTAFVRDVGVGLGHLLRRVGQNGRMEWAEAGRWNKSFERDDADSPRVMYNDAGPRVSEPLALAEELERPGERPRVAAVDIEPVVIAPPAPAVPVRPEAVKPARHEAPEVAEGNDFEETGGAPSLEQVFSDAVWLR